MKDEMVRLRPAPRYTAHDGRDLGEFDCTWRVGQPSDQALFLVQHGGPYKFRLPLDHIINFQTDAERPGCGILLIKSQVYMQEAEVRVEPIHPHPKVPTRTPTQTVKPAASVGDPAELRAEEVWVLQVFEIFGGRCLTPEQVSSSIATVRAEEFSLTKATYYLDRLVQGEYLYRGPQQMGAAPTYCLDHKGRGYLVENGLL